MSSNPPPNQPPDIGQIVTFNFSDSFGDDLSAHGQNGGELQAPAMIVAVKDAAAGTVNLRVVCNSHRLLFVERVTMGKGPGQWSR